MFAPVVFFIQKDLTFIMGGGTVSKYFNGKMAMKNSASRVGVYEKNWLFFKFYLVPPFDNKCQVPKESRQNLVKIFYLYNVKIDQFTPAPPLSLRTNFTMTITKDSMQKLNKYNAFA